jgi:hypothetical protein
MLFACPISALLTDVKLPITPWKYSWILIAPSPTPGRALIDLSTPSVCCGEQPSPRNKVFCRDASAQLSLSSLGPFSQKASDSWLWRYSPSKQRLFVPVGSGWDFYHVTSGRHHSVNHQYHCGGSTVNLPVATQAATVSIYGPITRLLARCSPPLPSPSAEPILSFTQILDSLPVLSVWVLQEYALPSDLSPIVRALGFRYCESSQ